MPKISLRAYNREIENLVDRGQTDHAIAHCKYILKQYPKHISTYRLLGKAYLESQRYTEAADIFQRVLAVLPDDFVAHLGMSIIREDEGDLDAAIWHMERAFEVQPSNNAVQGELRRLYGRRDGIEPPRVRLTRGALVRMYARGELYPQAIAEARAALAEDPSRLDIETILGRVYFLSGRKVEATEVCSNLITKLPYSLDANRILAEILPGTTRAEDAKSFQQAVISLDPYYAYISKATPESEDVPENAVMVEELEYEGSTEDDQNPDWARTIGADLGENEQAVPDWMKSIQSSSPAQEIAEEIEPSESSPAQTATEKASDIPEWMASAGWTPSTGEQPEETILYSDEEEAQPVEDIIPAEVPDWLKSLVPDEQPEGSADEDQERLSSLDAILPKEDQNSLPVTTSSFESESILPAESQVTLTPEESLSEETPESPSLEENSELPGWLNLDEEPDSYADTSEPTGPLSEYIHDIQQPSIPQPLVTTTGWLRGLGIPYQPENIETSEDLEPHSEEPQASQQGTTTVDQTETGAAPANGNNLDVAMTWLDSLADKQGADENLLSTPSDQRRITPPEWLTEDELILPMDGQSEETGEPGPAPEHQEMPAEPVSADKIDQPWQFQPGSEQETPAQSETQSAQPVAEEPEQISEPSTQPSDQDLDTAMNWLGSLAARQGTKEEQLSTSAEERDENPPDWIRHQMEAAADTSDSTSSVVPLQSLDQSDSSETELPSQAESASAETLPIDIASLYSEDAYVPASPVDETEFAQTEKKSQLENEFPDWLNQIIVDQIGDQDHETSQPGEPAVELPVESLEPELTQTENRLPDWLRNLDAETIAEEKVVSTESPAEIKPETSAIPAEETVIPISAEESTPEWLRDLQKLEPLDVNVSDQPAEISIQTLQTETPISVSAEQPLDQFESAAQPAREPVVETPPAIEPAELPTITYGPSHGSPEFETARVDLLNGKIENALNVINRMIEENQMLDEIISELRSALYRYPIDISLWQSLGDAYLHNNRIQDALDSYTKAEELLR